MTFDQRDPSKSLRSGTKSLGKIVLETVVEAPEVVDEPQALVLLGFPEDGYPILRRAHFLLREVATRSLFYILVDHVGQGNRLVKRLGDIAGDWD